MKRVLGVLLAVLLVTAVVEAQVSLTKLPVAFANWTYAASENDTSTSQQVAGSNRLSLVVKTIDSAAIDIYVQYKVDNTTWTTVLTDSLVTTTATGATEEFSIIDSDSDLFDAVAYGARVILAARATGCGVTTPTFTANWYLRP